MVRKIVLALLLIAAYQLGAISYRDDLFPLPQLRAAVHGGNLPGQAGWLPALHANQVSAFERFGRPAETVMVGDSITSLADWQEIFPRASIANRGIYGDTTTGVLARLPTILATKARQAFVMIGVNDLRGGRSVAATLGEHGKVLDALQAGGAHVVALSTLHVGAPEPLTLNPLIRELNAGIAAHCAAMAACTFVDLNKHLAPQGVLLSRFSSDGLHLNGPGYAAWRDAIAPSLP